MINRGVTIQYGDIAPDAKENFTPSASESQFDTLVQLQRQNLDFPNYANPCEVYSVILDGKAKPFPSFPEDSNLGLWSEQISNDDGTFTEPIVLELESVGQYSSQGLTLTFDTYNGIFATRVGIKWLRITDEGITTLDEKEYNPDNAFYFCRNFVENYNKVVIIFYSLNMPKNRLKLRAIDYGYGTFFYGDELRSVKLIQELDPISTQISINTADFTIDAKRNVQFSFQERQPLNIYFNGKLKATTFVKSSQRKTKNLWSIKSEDYIGIMGNVPYYGGIYSNAKALDLLSDIFSVAKVPYTIDLDLTDAEVTGYIPYTTCREALMQVAFAVQCIIDTSNSDAVKVFRLNEEVSQTVTLDRIMQGQSFSDEQVVTGVEVYWHSYKPAEEQKKLYDATKSGGGENIFVKFSEPMHDLSMVNGEIVQSGVNYAVINSSENGILTGKTYEHTVQAKRKNNPIVLAGSSENVVAIEKATLVSQYNVDNVLEKCYNWLTKTNTINLKIVEGKHVVYGDYIKYGQRKYGAFKYGAKHPNIVSYDEEVNVGDKIQVQTEYLGQADGIVTRQSFSLNGGIIVKDSTMR